MAILQQLSDALAGRYTIQRELGQGGMATVYLAEDLKHHRNVALKVLRPELAAILGGERFLKEIEVTANLQHPNILPLYDSGRAGEFLFYVMPYVEGETLRDRLDHEKQLSVEETVEIAKGVAAALQYAHEHKIVHRDIKPENVMLQGGQAIVADFGIALAVSQAGGTRLTETGLSLGTPHYMSPEQATGDRELDARSDIYSLGAMVYEMLTGDPPHTGSTLQAVIAKVLSEDPTPISRVRTLVPANVDAAVQRALAKTPADRFRSAADFAAALTNPSFALPTTVLHPAVAGPQRAGGLRGWRLGAALAATLVVGGIASHVLFGRKPAPPPVVAQFSVGVRLGDIDFGPGLDITPDGSEVVYIGRTINDRPVLFRRILAEPDAEPIAGTEGFVIRTPAISPDGRMVAFSSQSQLQIAALNGGGTRPLTAITPTSGGIAWGPGDVIVFQPSFGSGLMTITAEEGTPRVLTVVDSASGVDHRWPQVLPDGKTVLFTVWNGQPQSGRLATASLATGEVHDLLPGTFGRYTKGHLLFIGPDGTLQIVGFDLKSGETRGSPVATGEAAEAGGDGAAQFAVSATGTIAYLRSLGRRTPVLVDLDGKETPLPVEPALYLSPRFSPDGRAFALEVNGADVWVDDLALGTLSRLTDGGGFYPLWTPDGRRILYSRDEQANVNIYSVPVDRSEPPTPILHDAGQQRTQDLSPDGRHLLVRQNVGAGQYDIYVLALDSAGATPQPWLTTPFVERAPTFSRDGRWVAYTSNESGRDEVYVRPFPGPGGRIPVSSDGGTEPAWSPDGSGLYFRVGNDLERVAIETRPTFRVRSRPTIVLSGSYYLYPWQRQYDIHPDGRRFLFLKNEAEVNDLTVIVNWLTRWEQSRMVQ